MELYYNSMCLCVQTFVCINEGPFFYFGYNIFLKYLWNVELLDLLEKAENLISHIIFHVGSYSLTVLC